MLVPGSLVFTPTPGPVGLSDWRTWWRYVPGADWAHPEGPAPGTVGRELHPVTQVCWEDVASYAAWAGRQLPTEAEWEFAARGGLDGALYAWGDQLAPLGRQLANYWIGEFPSQNLKPAAERRTTAVRSYPPNGYGLFDVTGNVWEWTADFYRAGHAATAAHACCGPPVSPRVTDDGGTYGTEEPAGAISPGGLSRAARTCARRTTASGTVPRPGRPSPSSRACPTSGSAASLARLTLPDRSGSTSRLRGRGPHCRQHSAAWPRLRRRPPCLRSLAGDQPAKARQGAAGSPDPRCCCSCV